MGNEARFTMVRKPLKNVDCFMNLLCQHHIHRFPKFCKECKWNRNAVTEIPDNFKKTASYNRELLREK